MVDPASMLTGRTRETKIHRDDRGRWFNEGVEITHPLLTQAFDRWLVPAPDGSGRWCLSNSINWAYVRLDGPPRFIRSVRPDEDAGLCLRVSDGATVPLAADTLEVGPEGALYCEVDGLRARFDRHAMMQLAPWLGEDDAGIYLEVGDARVRPRASQEKS